MLYLDYLGEFWGELSRTPELASTWADHLAPTVAPMREHCPSSGEFGHFKGTSADLSALYALGRHDELLSLIAKSAYRHKPWHHKMWATKALAADSKRADAIRYPEGSKGLSALLMAGANALIQKNPISAIAEQRILTAYSVT